jgi:hypothetical protein
LIIRVAKAKQNPAPTQAGKVAAEILQHLHIRSEQMFGICDDADLLRQGRGQWGLHRFFQPQLGNALVDVAEQSKALIAPEVFDRNLRSPCTPKVLQGLGFTRQGRAVLTPNDQVLITL